MLRRFIFVFVLQFVFSGIHAQIFSSDLQKGLKAVNDNNFEKALGSFNGIIAQDSTDAGAHYGIAEVRLFV